MHKPLSHIIAGLKPQYPLTIALSIYLDNVFLRVLAEILLAFCQT